MTLFYRRSKTIKAHYVLRNEVDERIEIENKDKIPAHQAQFAFSVKRK